MRRFYVSLEDRDHAENFFSTYEPYVYQGTADTNRQEAIALRESVTQCRFCKKTREETTFTQDTHLISKLLGQNTYYSHDECDSCNQHFQRYESDLSHYLGSSRMFNHFRTDAKAPGFRSGNGAVKIRNYGNNFIYAENSQPEKGSFNIDMLSGKAEIKMETSPFIPQRVYAALLKMALACLHEPDIPLYEEAYKFVLHMESYPGTDRLKAVVITETDLVLGRPFAMIFKKKAGSGAPDLPEDIFCLHAGNLMFQLSIPDKAALTSDREPGKMPNAPYIQLDAEHPEDDIVRTRSTEDLSSAAETTKDQSIQMAFPTDNLIAINPGFDIKEFMDEVQRKKKPK